MHGHPLTDTRMHQKLTSQILNWASLRTLGPKKNSPVWVTFWFLLDFHRQCPGRWFLSLNSDQLGEHFVFLAMFEEVMIHHDWMWVVVKSSIYVSAVRSICFRITRSTSKPIYLSKAWKIAESAFFGWIMLHLSLRISLAQRTSSVFVATNPHVRRSVF